LSAANFRSTGCNRASLRTRRGVTAGRSFIWLLFIVAPKKSDSPRRAKQGVSNTMTIRIGFGLIEWLCLKRERWCHCHKEFILDTNG
jgi:hypothetical protein